MTRCDSPTTVGEFVEVNVMLLTTAHGVRYDTLGLELVDLSWVYSTSRAITRVGRALADADSCPVLLALKAAVTLGTSPLHRLVKHLSIHGVCVIALQVLRSELIRRAARG